MSRTGLVLAATLSATVWSACHAAGSFQKPEPHPVVRAGMPSVSLPSMPDVSASDLVGGCGRGRIRDPHTHSCRGPAEIR
jgi:hypothetical protein